MCDRSKLEPLRDVRVTRIGDTLSYGFPQTVKVQCYVITHVHNDYGENPVFHFPLDILKQISFVSHLYVFASRLN